MDLTQLQEMEKVYPLYVKKFKGFNPVSENASITDKVNELISYLNDIGYTVNDIVTDWNNVVKWLMTDAVKDIIEESNTEIVDARGTFPNLGNRLDNFDIQLADFVNDEYYNSDILFMASWNGYLDGSQFEFYVSNDGVKFKNINKDSIFKSVSGNVLDYQMYYENGTFYVLFDHGKSIHYAKSTDLVNWTQVNISISGFLNTWAPKWFKDNGKMYLFLPMNNGETANDIDGNSIQKLSLYYMVSTNNDYSSYSTPVALDLPDNTKNLIDPFVIKKDSTYHLFCKNDYNKTIEHYTNTVLDNSIQWVFMGTVSFPFRAEGPGITFFKGQYYMYVDCYESGFTMATTSPDLTTWSTPFLAGAENGATTRHFAPITISDENVKKVVKDFVNSQQKKTIDIVPNLYVHQKMRKDKNEIILSRGGTSTIDNLLAIKDKIYKVTGNGNITINSFNVDNLQPGDEIHFSVESGTLSAGITIVNSSNCLLPYDMNFTISQINGNNESIFTLKYVSGYLRPKGLTNMVQYNVIQKSTYNRVDLSTLAVNGIVSNLAIQDNTVYYVGANNVITVQSVSLANFPSSSLNHRIFFCLWSGSETASLTLVHGSTSNIYLPGETNLVISVTNKNNENLVPFTTHWGGLRMVGL